MRGGQRSPLPHLSIQMVPQMLDGIEIGALRRPWHAVDRVCLSPPSRISASVPGRVVLLEYHARDMLFNSSQVGHQVFADHVDIAVLVERAFDHHQRSHTPPRKTAPHHHRAPAKFHYRRQTVEVVSLSNSTPHPSPP